MMYKNLMAFLLLLPVLSYGNNKDTEKRILELKKAKSEKQLEISNLGKLILEKDELIQSFISRAANFTQELISKKEKIAIQNNGGNPLKKDAIEKIKADNQENFNQFVTNITKALSQENNVKGHLSSQIFNKETGKLDMNRMALIGIWLETELLKDYLEQYESAIQELIDIEKELETLTEQ